MYQTYGLTQTVKLNFPLKINKTMLVNIRSDIIMLFETKILMQEMATGQEKPDPNQ